MFCACVEVVFTLLRLRTSVACENNAKAVTLTGRQADTERYIDINRARGGGGAGYRHCADGQTRSTEIDR